ncbi:MAG: GNAT family N-acetyltransferase [Lachnospiraceae bacterium]|nr:GNAT family N-acetyltransferase [Lachnospiraceae bacterium]
MIKIITPDNSHILALRRLWKEAFGDSDTFLDAFFSTAYHANRCRCICKDDLPVAVLYWFDCLYDNHSIAYIYAVATAKSYQHQGLCHKLLADTHVHLKESGYAGALLVPGNEALFKLYEGMGYKTTCYIHKFTCTAKHSVFPADSVPPVDTVVPVDSVLPATVNTSLRRIDKKEYRHLRRHFLPEKGVIQENENLDFLETQMDFYTGNNLLFTACKKNDILHVAELLGNTESAKEILQALGCRKGFFKTPGTDSPFAMYYPLNNKKLTPPSYFGLAFDE